MPLREEAAGKPALVAFSHLRWNFVTQRPQHLMARCARERQVFFVEEPIWVDDGAGAGLDLSRSPEGVVIVVPQLPPFLARDLDAVERTIASLVSAFLSEQGITRPVFWYWTPMALAWTTAIEASAVIYDCMDELSLFVGAPPQLLPREAELLFRADLVFTGGRSLFEAKSPRHSSVHLFPSSIEATHFGRARCLAEATEPADQAEIPHPRLGFFGVIDERFDVDLVAGLAVARPDWHLVLIGPVVKIDPQSLPKAKNLHFLGGKGYGELPAYLAGWDVALLPFAANDSTRFISPTKTPEYLAGGRRVVSTPINDVIEPYGRLGLVEIAQGIEDFAAAVERCLGATDSQSWLDRVDAHLAQMSWDETWRLMSNEIDAVMETKRRPARSGARSSPSVFR